MRSDEYLKTLPDGIDSYPECTCKVSTIKTFLEAYRRDFPAEPLPDALCAPAAQPVSGWVREAQANALFVAMSERFADDAAYIAWCRDGNRALLSSPLYRALFWLVSPQRVVRSAAERWGRFHAGTPLVTDVIGDKSVTLTLHYPPHLMPPVMLLGYAGAFEVAAELSGGAPARFVVERQTPTSAQFSGTWS